MSAIGVHWIEPGILRVEFRHVHGNEEFERYLDTLSDVLRDERPYATVIVDSAGLRLQVEHRRRKAEWLRDNEDLIARVCVGTAFVLTSAISRLVLSTILLVARVPSPHRVFAHEPEGLSWARDRLRLAA